MADSGQATDVQDVHRCKEPFRLMAERFEQPWLRNYLVKDDEYGRNSRESFPKA
jgi:hypothetical protein